MTSNLQIQILWSTIQDKGPSNQAVTGRGETGFYMRIFFTHTYKYNPHK